MHPLLAPDAEASAARPIHFVTHATAEAVLSGLPASQRDWVAANGFEPAPGRHLVLPGADSSIAGVLFAIEEADALHRDLFLPAKLTTILPAGLYRFAGDPHDARLATLGWLLGSYRFARYRKNNGSQPRLVLPAGVDAAMVTRIAEAVSLGRDLVATPANDLGPEELEAAIRLVAQTHGASVRSIVGDDLLRENLPMVHAVGRASTRPPRLVDLSWGDPAHPKVTLVGKGVVFDTGGLNIKPDAAMLLMKKDMGGAASALSCAAMVMGAGLPVRLRLLVPAVENAISGSSFRPGDVLPSRKGITVEIGNTDAEGRLILADALALADEEAPELIVDMATLTGAARVALGPELPALFSNDDAVAEALYRHGMGEADPLWRMPLWPPYDSLLDSKIADVNHISGGPFAGSLTAALFLRRFVTAARAHVHLDMFCWNPSAKPGRPEGPEVMGARAVFAYLKTRFG
jgi:leucyl aminopeptidase